MSACQLPSYSRPTRASAYPRSSRATNRPLTSHTASCGVGAGSPDEMMRTRSNDSGTDSARGSASAAARRRPRAPRRPARVAAADRTSAAEMRSRRSIASASATRSSTSRWAARSASVRSGTVSRTPSRVHMSAGASRETWPTTPRRRGAHTPVGTVISIPAVTSPTDGNPNAARAVSWLQAASGGRPCRFRPRLSRQGRSARATRRTQAQSCVLTECCEVVAELRCGRNGTVGRWPT